MTPEAKARQQIDLKLQQAGWVIQDMKQLNLGAGFSMAVREYLEQLTYLLFLKLAHEYSQDPYNRDTHVPDGYDWTNLTSKVGEPLERQYVRTLNKLGKEPVQEPQNQI